MSNNFSGGAPAPDDGGPRPALTAYHDAIPLLLQTNQKFPVDFDELWQWCGYTRKDNAKRILDGNRAEFVENEDFANLLNIEGINRRGVRPQRIMLTVEAAKAFCMLSQTTRGADVRRYFIAVEKRYVEAMQTLPSAEEPKLLREGEEVVTLVEYFQGEVDWAELKTFARELRSRALTLGVPTQRKVYNRMPPMYAYQRDWLNERYKEWRTGPAGQDFARQQRQKGLMREKYHDVARLLAIAAAKMKVATTMHADELAALAAKEKLCQDLLGGNDVLKGMGRRLSYWMRETLWDGKNRKFYVEKRREKGGMAYNFTFIDTAKD